jgi:hypothetical protein
VRDDSAVSRGRWNGDGRDLSNRDRDALEFLSLHPTVITEHVQVSLRADSSGAVECLQRLESFGLARSRRSSADGPASWQITPAGLDAIDSRLPAPEVPIRDEFEHAVVWPWLAAKDGSFGELERVYTQRELRSGKEQARSNDWRTSVDAAGRDRAAPPFAVELHDWTDGPSSGLRYPDLMLVLEQGRIPVHLQLHPPDIGASAEPRSRYVAYAIAKPGKRNVG